MEKRQRRIVEEMEGMPELEELDVPYDEGEKQKPASPTKRQKPIYRVVATTRDRDGTERLVTIGGAWLRVSKSGRKYLDLRLGYLKLFPVE